MNIPSDFSNAVAFSHNAKNLSVTTQMLWYKTTANWLQALKELSSTNTSTQEH